MIKVLLFTTIGFTFASWASAETLTFSSAWAEINGGSAAQEGSRLETRSLIESQARASRHWLPKVYLDAKSYQTNDPGASFFGLLEQRSIQQSDFNPDSINHPKARLYTRGALGLDLPLFEGGMKTSQVDMLKHSVAAQEKSTSQIQIEQYSATGLSYASIAVLEQQKNKLKTLSSEVSRMIKSYQLGSKSNPVGYSGLLGMKSLANRVSGLINQYESQTKAHYAGLVEMGLKDQEWSPEPIDSISFVDRYFFNVSKNSETLASFKVESAKESVKASEEAANMEKAKFQPRVGAFAESYIFNGNRETANGYSAGLYLQWNLFDPSEYGGLKAAKLKSLSVAKYAEASERQERAEHTALREAIKSLKLNIELLNDSDKLLVEQSKMTETLFKNGSISALQIVEILNRRADLIAQQNEAELNLIVAGSRIVTKQNFDISKQLNHGVSNEK